MDSTSTSEDYVLPQKTSKSTNNISPIDKLGVSGKHAQLNSTQIFNIWNIFKKCGSLTYSLTQGLIIAASSQLKIKLMENSPSSVEHQV